MTWRYLLTRYAWLVIAREGLRSSRWSDDEKAEWLVLMGILLSIPFTLAHALWLLTRRGPIRWIYRPTVAFVNPFSTSKGWTPPDNIQAALPRRLERDRQ